MKIQVDIVGVGAVRARLNGLSKQVDYAAAVALTRTAKAVEDEVRRTLPGAFDRPKPQTVRATYVTKATRNDLSATVGIKGRARGVPAAEYLHPNLGSGGAKNPRLYKRSEYMLASAGILPRGMYTVPGAGAKLDAYGNMSRGQIVQILSFFRTFGNSTLNTTRMNMKDQSRQKIINRAADYFVVPVRDRKIKLYPGIWKRSGKADITPILMFVSRPLYNAIYDMEDGAKKVTRFRFRTEFDAALEMALRTAR